MEALPSMVFETSSAEYIILPRPTTTVVGLLLVLGDLRCMVEGGGVFIDFRGDWDNFHFVVFRVFLGFFGDFRLAAGCLVR